MYSRSIEAHQKKGKKNLVKAAVARPSYRAQIKDKEKEADRRRGGKKKIKELIGIDFTSSARVSENRTRWKGIVANSSVVPRRPSKVMG